MQLGQPGAPADRGRIGLALGGDELIQSLDGGRVGGMGAAVERRRLLV